MTPHGTATVEVGDHRENGRRVKSWDVRCPVCVSGPFLSRRSAAEYRDLHNGRPRLSARAWQAAAFATALVATGVFGVLLAAGYNVAAVVVYAVDIAAVVVMLGRWVEARDAERTPRPRRSPEASVHVDSITPERVARSVTEAVKGARR